MAFRSVTTSIQSKRDQIRRILQLPPPATTAEDKEKTKKDQVRLKFSERRHLKVIVGASN